MDGRLALNRIHLERQLIRSEPPVVDGRLALNRNRGSGSKTVVEEVDSLRLRRCWTGLGPLLTKTSVAEEALIRLRLF